MSFIIPAWKIWIPPYNPFTGFYVATGLMASEMALYIKTCLPVMPIYGIPGKITGQSALSASSANASNHPEVNRDHSNTRRCRTNQAFRPPE